MIFQTRSSVSGKESREKAIRYCEQHHTDPSVVMAVAGAANVNIDYHAFQKGGADMCTLFDQIAKEHTEKGRTEGRAEGIIKSGRRHAFSDEVILQDIMAEIGCDRIAAESALQNFNLKNRMES